MRHTSANRVLVEGAYRIHYDASSDGEHLLLVEGGDDPSSHRLHVVLNWLEEPY